MDHPSAARPHVAAVVSLVLALGALAAPPDACAQLYAPETFNVDNCVPPISNAKYYRSKPGQEQLQRAHQKWGKNVYKKASHKRFEHCQQPPQRGNPNPSIHDFQSEVDGLFSPDGGISFVPINAPAHCVVSMTYNHTSGDVDYYDNRMLALDVTGLPFGMRVRQSPTRQSLGMTTVRPAPGGYWISSFFDVFTDLSEDGGLTWIPSNDSLGVPLAGHMALDVVDAPLGVDPSPARSEFLYVPNPLQRGARIRFAVTRPGAAKLQVFDLLGRRVATLHDDGNDAGERTLIWDGTDRHGRTLEPGVYLFHLATQGGRETARAVYTR